jgi:FkbM family methyltransferase
MSLCIPVLVGPGRGHWFAAGGVRSALALMAGRYERPVARFFQESLRTSEVFFDVGAHTGYFTRLALRVMPKDGRVVAFEPDRACFEKLKAVGHEQRVSLRLEAIGSMNTTGTLVSSRGACSRLVDAMPLPNGGDYASATEVRTLTDLVREGAVPQPDTMKVDVEGSEMDVLSGAVDILGEVQALAVECHSMPLLKDVLDFVLGSSFTWVRVTAGGDYFGPPTVLARRH